MGTKATRDGINEEIAEAATDQVRDYCRRQRVTSKWLADVLGYCDTTFSNYLNGNRPLPASLVVRVTIRCGFSLINELCRQCGGVFIPVSKRAQFGNGSAAYHAALKFVETSGAAAKSFFTALEDGVRLTLDAGARVAA